MVVTGGNRLVIAPFSDTNSAASTGYVSSTTDTSNYTAVSNNATRSESEVYVFGSEHISSGSIYLW